MTPADISSMLSGFTFSWVRGEREKEGRGEEREREKKRGERRGGEKEKREERTKLKD